MKRKTVSLVALVLLFAAAQIHGQSRASISYAEGGGFVLVSDGERTEYDISSDDVIGLQIQEGDTILTDHDSFLELILSSGNGSVIKIAENTTFSLDRLEENGGGIFRVVYGRIRVKAATLLGGARIWVTGYDTVAGVRGTDFGYDLFYDPVDDGSIRDSAVYVFEGEVDVVRYTPETTSKLDLMTAEPFVLSSGNMVSVSSDAPDEKFRAKNIDQSILDYWAARPIITDIGEEAGAGEAMTVSEDLNLADPLTDEQKSWEEGGKITFVTGIGFMTLAGLLQVFVPQQRSASLGFLTVGAATTLTGGAMILYSVSLR